MTGADRDAADDVTLAVRWPSPPDGQHVARPADWATGLFKKLDPLPGDREPLRVEVVGGGPVGLSFACTLRAMMGDQVVIRIHDRRWKRQGNKVVWLGQAEGNFRREQVVTLQSNVWSTLPHQVQERLFTQGRFGEMWPLGPDSPEGKGRPRNIKIRWIEDALLEMAQELYDIELVPGRYEVPPTWDGTQVLVVADGANSPTRTALKDHFGTPDRNFYSVDGEQLVETVLGIRVRGNFPDEHTVPLTVGQNRYLFNSLGGGFINMRLTAEEASEIVAIGENAPVECIRTYRCMMLPRGDRFVCDRHRAIFKPSVDRLSFLWPRILDGARLFGAGPGDILGITMFNLSMTQNARFTAQLGPSTFGFLIGDAANSLHFWPGRGLNTGVKSALSLAGTLRSRWQGRQFRSSDFSAHEGLMQQLQYREKSRAWTTMLMPDQDGMPRLVEDRLRDGLTGPHDRAALVRVLFERVKDVKARMTGRMGPLPADEWYLERINGLHVKTLKQLVESGPWITREIGGDEVSVDVDFADIATDPNPPLPVLVPQVDPEQTTLTPLRALMAAARPPAPAGCSEPTVLTSLSDVLPVANA
ncbi:hypothetical protein ACFFSW_35335 [Saccharothrix longispora]|uniref:FHA domain-containing protein n=1 Tax=Saccharothrix longispora TaxID=33920 RepID=A0ABU1PS18_9PSEU|nr:hypothetical protein [Saccharothrix longispora]MDR6593445.1 hypothetical protein [Saccharothrix longispora]